VARRLLHLGRRHVDTGRLRTRLDLVADRTLNLAPVAVEGGGQFVVRELRPVTFAPGRAVHGPRPIILETLEEGPPLVVDRGRVGLVARVEIFDVAGVAAVEEGGKGESGVRVLAGHAPRPVARVSGLA